MSRWWASADESLAVLDLVDDSDVEQGVGTAILAYHGLAAGALEPLTRRTLMDVSAVRHALSGVDLEPVAKALAAATAPVMGDASGAYGQILADDLHRQATEATERLLLSLTSTGMPWPTAIERVATVHGVPLERLGQAASKLAAPALTPLVRADLGDRALMDYAMHRGLRENTVVDVAKAQAAQAFDPNEHPRGAKGQFRRKPARKEPDAAFAARQERAARSARGLRASRGKAVRENVRRTAAAETAQPAQRSLMSLLGDAFAPAETAPNATVARMTFRERRDKANSRRRKAGGTGQTEDADLTRPIAQKAGEYRIDGERTYLIQREWADKIVEGGVVSGRLEDSMHKMGWLSPDETKSLLLQAVDNPGMLTDYVVLEMVDDIPVNGGGKRDDQVQVARSALLVPANPDATLFDAYDRADNYAVPVRGNKRHLRARMRVDHTFRLPVLRVVAANADSYDKQPDDGPPGISKATSAFDPNEHPRGSKGRFRNKPDHLEPDMMALRSREERSARSARSRRSARGQARRVVEVAPTQQASLMAVLADRIKADPLAQDLDSVDELAARRGRKSFRELARSRDRGSKRSRPVADLDMAYAQVYQLTDDQVYAIDQAGRQDTDPLVVMADVMSQGRNSTHSSSALLGMRETARRQIMTRAKGRHASADFTAATTYATSDEAYAAGAKFVDTLSAVTADGSGVTWKDDDGLHAWSANTVNASNLYVESVSDSNGHLGYKPKVVIQFGGIEAQSVVLGSESDMARLREGELPDSFVEGETTFRQMAQAARMNPDMINSTPDFVIRTIRPVFGHNDD